MTRPRMADRVESARAQTRVLDRVRRWAAATDRRVVRRLWPAQPDRAQWALCPGCGAILRDGTIVTLSRETNSPRAEPVRAALAAGDLGALAPGRPREPGELWCVVCRLCLEDRARTAGDLGLPERLDALVEEALRHG